MMNISILNSSWDIKTFDERNDEIMKMFINRDNNDIGETIKRCREYNGFTLRELGLLSGFSVENAHSRIYQYESGRCVACPEITERIADALGISKYAISPLDISDEKAVLFTLLKIIRKYDIKIRKAGRLCLLEFPEELAYLNGCLNFYYKAQEQNRMGNISDEDLDYIAQSVNTCIDIPAILMPIELKEASSDDVIYSVSPSVEECLLLVAAKNREEADRKIKEYIQKNPIDTDELIDAFLDKESFTRYKSGRAMGIPEDVYNKLVSEKLKEKLVAKMIDEQARWLTEIETLPQSEIIKMASKIAVREDIILYIESADNPNINSLITLLNMENPLEACSEHWEENKILTEYMDSLDGVIADLADSKAYEL